jgi:hypothetical protein
MLVFKDGGWTVCTGGYTVAAKHGRGIVICYPWSGMSGISAWGDAATGVARVELEIPMELFLDVAAKARGGVIDLRSHQ